MIIEGSTVPARVVPVDNGTTTASLSEWCAAHRSELRRLLSDKGAVLLRGFSVETPQDFSEVAHAVSGGALQQYVAGVARRRRIADGVYSSTEYPPDVDMPCHNELAHTRDWPQLILFWCQEPPVAQGQTPLIDGRRILRGLAPATIERFRNKEVTYVRYLHCGDDSGVLERNIRVLDPSGYPYGLSWQLTYGTSDRGVVERRAREVGASVTWTAEGGALWRETLPAMRPHYLTGEECWFNHVVTFHPSRMPSNARAGIDEQQYPRNVLYGDGTKIADETVREVRSAMAEEEVVFDWQRGDVLVIDNLLAMHGRRTYSGPRRLLVAMAGAGGASAAADHGAGSER